MKRTTFMCLAIAASLTAFPAVALDNLTLTLDMCADASSPTRDHITNYEACGVNTVKLRYMSNLSLTTPNDLKDVTKALIMVHGSGINPTDVYNPVMADITTAGLQKKVLLIAPQFLEDTDYPGVNDVLKWPFEEEINYAAGGVSTVPANVELSSFDVMDAIVRKLKAKVPGIKEIILGGHAAGGQMLLRYSMATQIETHPEMEGVKFRYIISAPRVYVYFDGVRYDTDLTRWTLKTVDTSKCPGYNDYRYGLENIPYDHYMATFTPEELSDRFNEKRRLFLVGSKDTGGLTNDKCMEKIQGMPGRVDRAFNYMHHLRVQGKGESASFCVVKGIAHDGDVLGSGASTLFWKDNMVDCSYDDGL